MSAHTNTNGGSKSLMASGRLKFIDGLRGIAVLMVTFFHFFDNSPYKETFQQFLPDPVCWVLGHGWLGVYIFFVISGFVIAHAISGDRITPRYAAVFVIRRSIRLDPPYWVTIASWVGLTWLSNLLLPTRSLPYPSLEQLVSHLFYLQNILGYRDIVPIFWTLCLELQFYTVYILLVVLMCWGGTDQEGLRAQGFRVIGASLFYGITILSWLSAVFHILPGSITSVWFIGAWFNFGLGVLLAKAAEDRTRSLPVYGMMALLVFSLIYKWTNGTVLILATATSIFVAARRGALGHWLNGRFIQYCGRLSYSIYLTHFVFGLRAINIAYRMLGDSVPACLLATSIGLAITFASAHLMNRFIEEPSIRFAKRVRGYLMPARV